MDGYFVLDLDGRLICTGDPALKPMMPRPDIVSSSLFITLSLELSDTQVFEPYIRALLGTDVVGQSESLAQASTPDRYSSRYENN